MANQPGTTGMREGSSVGVSAYMAGLCLHGHGSENPGQCRRYAGALPRVYSGNVAVRQRAVAGAAATERASGSGSAGNGKVNGNAAANPAMRSVMRSVVREPCGSQPRSRPRAGVCRCVYRGA